MKPTILDWIGLRQVFDLTPARWLGGLVGVLAVLLVFVLLLICAATLIRLAAAVLGPFAEGAPWHEAIRNSWSALAVLVGTPFVVWRTWVADKQAHR